MDKNQFWEIIARSRPERDAHPEDCEPRLIELLQALSSDDIVEWNHIFDQLAKDAYTLEQLAACNLINGGGSDDGFYYYRCRLIGMGREVYENAMSEPDSLADALHDDEEAEAEIYAAAHRAWMAVTGNPDTAPYPARHEKAEMKGEPWDIHDDNQLRTRMPKLLAKYD